MLFKELIGLGLINGFLKLLRGGVVLGLQELFVHGRQVEVFLEVGVLALPRFFRRFARLASAGFRHRTDSTWNCRFDV